MTSNQANCVLSVLLLSALSIPQIMGTNTHYPPHAVSANPSAPSLSASAQVRVSVSASASVNINPSANVSVSAPKLPTTQGHYVHGGEATRETSANGSGQLKVISINVQGLNRKMQDLRGFIESSRPDVLCVQEPKGGPRSRFSLAGCRIFQIYKSPQRQGLVTYVKNCYVVEMLPQSKCLQLR